MKEKITGILSFICNLSMLILAIYVLYDISFSKPKEFFVLLLMFSISIFSLLYLIWTKFWTLKNSKLDQIDYENKVLEKEIKRMELKKQLEQ